MKPTSDICQRLISEAQSYGEFSQHIQQLSQSIWAIITTEAEEGSSQFSPICQLLDDISSCNMSIGLMIRRSIEDLNDILERDKVLQRKIKEHSQIVQVYEKNKQNLAQSKANLEMIENNPKYFIKKMSLQKDITRLQSELKTKTKDARDATISLIEEKKKVKAFNVRRIRSAFQNIGNALKNNYETSVTLFNRFKEGIEEIEKGNDLSTFVLYGQDQAPELPSDMKTLKYIAGVTTKIVNVNDSEYVLYDKAEKSINEIQSQKDNNTENDQNQNNQSKDNQNPQSNQTEQVENKNEQTLQNQNDQLNNQNEQSKENQNQSNVNSDIQNTESENQNDQLNNQNEQSKENQNQSNVNPDIQNTENENQKEENVEQLEDGNNNSPQD